MDYFLLYLGLGVIVGILAGLLGVGGGAVIVPVLVFSFGASGFSDAYIMQMALGTSLASIMFTSLSSLRAHHQHGAVNWDVVKRITPGILVGTLCGALLAAMIPAKFLKVFFVVFLFYVATQTMLNIKPHPARQLPGRLGLFGVGSLIGMVSSWVGIGGGALSVPFMVWCNIKMHQAIGTSSAIGFPIAIAGTVGYVLSGWHIASLPSQSLGFIYLPALAGLTMASIVFAPVGAKLAHRLPVAKLKKIFAIMLYLLGARMLVSLF